MSLGRTDEARSLPAQAHAHGVSEAVSARLEARLKKSATALGRQDPVEPIAGPDPSLSSEAARAGTGAHGRIAPAIPKLRSPVQHSRCEQRRAGATRADRNLCQSFSPTPSTLLRSGA